jgi:hypothetical protein
MIAVRRTYTMRKARRTRRFRSQAAVAALAACTAIAGPGRAVAQNNIVQTMIPAFYQHQGDDGPDVTSSTRSKATATQLGALINVWNPDDGWCAFVADLDALYPWEKLTVGGVHPYDNASVWLFGKPGVANPLTGSALTTAGTWLQTADDTAIPDLISATSIGLTGENLTINNYLKQQKVGPASLGLLGLVDTQYQVAASGQVQVATIDGWENIAPTTFQLYQQLTGAGAKLPAALQPLAAITTTLKLEYAGNNSAATTGFWWGGFHEVAGAGVAGQNTIQYSDPDAIPINAQANGVAAGMSRNGGDTQAAVNNNEYNSKALPNQSAGPPPVPGAGAYTANNLYSTMVINAAGGVVGGNGPYATGLNGAKSPVTRVAGIDAISVAGVQIASIVVKPLFDAVSFLFSGNFGGDVSKLEIFANSPLYASNLGLSETDPDWSISQVITDPYGNSWASTDGGILLSEGAGGSDLMEMGQTTWPRRTQAAQ